MVRRGKVRMEPYITVIIPVYNVEKYLKKAVDSVLNQTMKNIEVILVDDGSFDNSCKIIDEYAKNDLRVMIIHQKNKGVSAARNSGLLLAKGQYISFLDPDDWIESNMYEVLYAEAISNNCDLVMCNFLVKDIGGQTLRASQHSFKSNCLLERENIKNEICNQLLVNGFFTAVWDKIYLRSFLNENKIFFRENIPIREDYFFNIDIFNYSQRAIYVDRPFYNYQVVSNSASKKYYKNSFELAVKLYKYKINYSNIWSMNTAEHIEKMAYDFLDEVQASIMQIFNNKNINNFTRKIEEVRYIVNNVTVRESLNNYANRESIYIKDKSMSVKIRLINNKSVFLLLILSFIANKIPIRIKKMLK